MSRYLDRDQPPRVLPWRGIRSNNLTVVPASMLPFKRDWQLLANRLEPGGTLFVVPAGETPLKRSMRRLAGVLRAKGHAIAAVPSDTFF